MDCCTWKRVLIAALPMCIGACGTVSDGELLPGAGWAASNPTSVPIEPTAVVDGEQPSPFGDALRLNLEATGSVSIAGRVESPDSVVVYAIGASLPGEQIDVDVVALTEGFDPAVAAFDESANWLHLNDNAGLPGRLLDAAIDWTADRNVSECYVVVSASSKSDSAGEYLLTIKRSTEAVIRPPVEQVVFLEFGGGLGVSIGRRTPVDVPPFSGELIAPEFAGSTDELIRLVTQRVRADFAHYGVTIVASHESLSPSGPHTSVYFGSYDPALLGIADNVDVGNAEPVQDAIVFVDTFSVFISQDPTVVEMANALANVASHEIGHLLGLHHTADTRSLMDTTASLRQMLATQTFRRAPLHGDTFRVGYQSAPATLVANTGGDLESARAVEIRSIPKVRDPWYDGGPPGPIRDRLRFGTACSGH